MATGRRSNRDVCGHPVMSSYYNLPLEQRCLRHLVAQFNCDEQLWLSLGSERCRRRKLYPWMSARLQKQLDLLEFVSSLFDFILGTHPISRKGTTELGRSEATKRF